MKVYGKMMMGKNSPIENLTVPYDSVFPSPDESELAGLRGHATLPDGLYYYLNGNWVRISPPYDSAVEEDFGWKDLTANLAMSRAGGEKPPLWESFYNGIYAWAFRASQTNELWVNFHLGHDYKLGTNIFPHVHWAVTTNTTGLVRWGLEYTVAKGHQQEAFIAPTTLYIEQNATGTPRMHMVAEDDNVFIDPTHLEPDSLIMCRLFRDGGNDTIGDSVFAFQCDLHYQADRLHTPNKSPNFYGP